MFWVSWLSTLSVTGYAAEGDLVLTAAALTGRSSLRRGARPTTPPEQQSARHPEG